MEEQNDIIEQPPEHDRPPRSKARLAFTIALLLVILLLLIAIFSPLRDVAINHFLATAPSPTATLVAGDDLIDIQALPPGTVTIDGHAINKSTHPNDPNFTPKSIRLSRGQHKIVWQAAPFLPLTCIISVPPLSSDPCNYESNGNSTTAPGTRLIAFSASLSDLPSDQQTALKQAIQAEFNTLQSTDTVLAGEQYLFAPSSGGTIVKTAAQPLQATLGFHLDANPASQNSCQNGYGDTCNINGQSCLQFCTPQYFDGYSPIEGMQLTWDFIALYYPSWSYTTQSGQVVAQNQPDTSNSASGQDHSISLRAGWDGAKWHVFPNITPEAVTQFEASPDCASFVNQISATTQYGVTVGGTNVDWGYAASTNEAQGCLGVVVPSPGQQTPTNFKQPSALFLYRFGVLLAANPLAHSEFPRIPRADANEQAIAQSIAAKLKYP